MSQRDQQLWMERIARVLAELKKEPRLDRPMASDTRPAAGERRPES
jgi:hypothetical protein